jgi:clathrin heavy chain
MDVLVNNIKDINRSSEYAHKVNIPEVWSKLGQQYLNENEIPNAIDCYIKANDSENYHAVVN